MKTTEVLLVDDNPADTDLTSEVLSRNGCPSHIHSVFNGVDAIAFLRRKGKYANVPLPDFMILDLSLPGKGWARGAGRGQSRSGIAQDSDCDLQHVGGAARHYPQL